ncbi:PRC-barrel domain-containing protein [Opitutus terrae]|uniref:PRC-barrel domain protein n=1 Tax=Opitutus terrae (strain DSM 11246 / JCM 15787 / PB90-1) TaxID=452637 RepID=B1ZNI2_OPITP|nr:PRC-barrel domain-containing protein [Opitutus terrae]ACB74416.1 PRC-barrel domain protein [Opitutus terrae PB90-1]
MKTKIPPSLTFSFAVALCVASAAPAFAAGATAAAEKKSGTDGVTAAQHQLAGQSAQKLIGQDVRNPAGEGLGQVKDLVIDARAGQLVYALVSSGGLLGVGERIRAVPFAAFKDTYRADGDLVLPIDRTAWNNLAAIRETEIDTLLSEARASTLFSQFGLEWKDETKRLRRDAKAAGADTDSTPKLMRVAKLTGKDVVNAGQEVGKIEDIVLNFESRRASVLLDPNDDYTGSNQKFIVDFSQLSRSLDVPEKLTTVLTKADFARATPMQDDWWMMSSGYPYIWTGYSMVGGPGYAAAVTGAERAMGTAEERRAGQANARPSVEVIRDALRRDERIGEAARDVSVEQRKDKLVVTGTVPSAQAKRQIGDRLAELALGWEVDNELTVRSVGE